MSDYLREFFVVTMSSVYKVIARGDKGYPVAEKIELEGESALPVGSLIEDGMMLAIAQNLQAYIPEGHGLASCLTSVERNLEEVNTMWWRTGTSHIVALFLTEQPARDCLRQKDLQACDQRWLKETKEVLEAIGNEHPTITVCRFPSLALAAAI